MSKWDIAGRTFGKLTAVERSNRTTEEGRYYWKFLCTCGEIVEKIPKTLRKSLPENQNCGCSRVRTNLTGIKFNRLTVLSLSSKRGKEGQYYWDCLCDCGETKTILGTSLNNNKSLSCGCYSREVTSKVFKTHGRTKHSVYYAYNNMITRTSDVNYVGYVDYGGRGITVCDRWLESFENFLEDMGDKPSSLHTIERVDVNGNYCPENCIWLEREYQNRNQRQRKDNSSGTVGVHKQLKGKYEYWTAQWNNLSKKRCGKQFNCATYGEELAFFMACEYREQMINLLNLQGAGYTEGHGKVKSIIGATI